MRPWLLSTVGGRFAFMTRDRGRYTFVVCTSRKQVSPTSSLCGWSAIRHMKRPLLRRLGRRRALGKLSKSLNLSCVFFELIAVVGSFTCTSSIVGVSTGVGVALPRQLVAVDHSNKGQREHFISRVLSLSFPPLQDGTSRPCRPYEPRYLCRSFDRAHLFDA